MRWILPTLVFVGFSLCSHAAGVNLIANGGFERGDGGIDGKQPGVGKGWEAVCGGSHPEIYALDSHVKHSGRYSQRMSCEGYNYRYLPKGGYCYHTESGKEIRHKCPTELGLQAIAQTTRKGAIQPGATYECSAWVKIEGLTESWEWFRLGIYWLDADGKFLSETREDREVSKNNYGTHDWKEIRIVARAPEKAAYAKVYLHHHFVHGTVWYDDISLIHVR